MWGANAANNGSRAVRATPANGHDETPAGKEPKEAEVSPFKGKRLRCETCKEAQSRTRS